LVASSIHLNEALISDLRKKGNDVKLIAITAGNPTLWKDILSNNGLEVTVLESDYIVSKYVKYYVLKELQTRCKYVLAIGDSMIDSLMLSYANKSYLISNKGYREKLYQLLKENESIYQLSYNGYLYKNIRTDDHISEIKCLKHTDSISALIEECKSSSGVEGYRLRKAHYKLGLEIGKLISADSTQDKYCVVIMMRSGLPFGQGVADYLDCPEVFCYNNSSEEVIRCINDNPELTNRTLILCDGVVNSGTTVNALVSRICGKSIIATNVISTNYESHLYCPIYATRVSNNSYIGAKQRVVAEGKGPDTSDRLFRTL